MDVKTVLIALLRAELCGESVAEDIKEAISPEMLPDLYKCANRHDLAHIVGNALGKLGVLKEDETSGKFKQVAMKAVYRYVLLERTLEQICTTLEQAKIPHIPLKGSVLRRYYPEPWLRTSCDIDVLVREEDLDAATDIFRNQLHYDVKGKSSHDISMFSPEGVHFELHYDTIDDGWASEGRKVMAHVWEYAEPGEDGSFRYILLDEMFYFYHIAHMARHFENGGCGIRPFLDLWLLNHKIPYDREKRNALLEEGKLSLFAEAMEKLSEVWFSGAEKDLLSEQVENYLFSGGVYGTWENNVTIRRGKVGSRLKFLKFRIFMPYNYMCARYPILIKRRWLTPIYEVVRWVEVFTKKKTKKAMVEFKTNVAISDSESRETKAFLKRLGL